MQLQATAFGLAGGVLWGVSVLLMTLVSAFTGYASLFLHILMEIYPGFEVTLLGAIIGLGYAFVDGFLGGFVLAWLYNRFAH